SDQFEIINLNTGQVLDTFSTENRLNRLIASAARPLIAAGTEEGHIHVWDTTTRRHLDIAGHQNHVVALAFNKEGTMLASLSSGHEFRLWDPLTGQLMLSGTGSGQDIRFAVDDRYVALGESDGQHIVLYEVILPPSLRLLTPARAEKSNGALTF